MQAASVAGALERVDDGVGFEFGKLGQAQGERLLDFSAERETPVRRGIEFDSVRTCDCARRSEGPE